LQLSDFSRTSHAFALLDSGDIQSLHKALPGYQADQHFLQ
jgi:hypothetical protein